MDINTAYKELVKNEYRAYCHYVHRGSWKATKLGSYLADTIQGFVERKSNKPYEILLLSVPPQHGKSMTITETYPSFHLGRHPEDSVIEISYSEDFATLFGRRNKGKIGEYGSDLFGVELASSPNSNTEFEIKGTRGGMISRGILSGVTGRPANLMIIDDPIKTREDADSPKYRQKLKEEWLSSYKTRLAPGAKVIVIQTRWHTDDLIGYLLETEENVCYINIPCEAEEGDVLGREIGDSLLPELGKDNEWLKEFKKSYKYDEGSRAWFSLYQGKPVIEGGNIIKSEWWQYYDKLPELVEVVLSVDCAFKDKESNDFVAMQIWGKAGANIYLVHAIKKHLDFPKTIAMIRLLKSMHPDISRIYIEDKANGSAVIQVLKREISGIIPVEPKGGKIARAHAVSGAIESGHVYLPKDKSFVKDFMEECSRFPNAEHDDQVDAMTQGLNKLIFKSGRRRRRKDKSIEDMFLSGITGKQVAKNIGKGDKISVV